MDETQNLFQLMDEETKKAYLEGNLKFQRGKMVLGDQEITFMEMNKGEVMSSNFNRLYEVIRDLEKNDRKGFASMYLGIGGWDDVPDPIYEIMPIRRFYMKLFKKMPHFLFYISPLRETPTYILACLSDIEVKARHGKWVAPLDEVKEKGHTAELGSTTIEVQMSANIGYKMINAIQAHAGKVGFEDKSEELPVVYRLIENMIKVEERENKYT